MKHIFYVVILLLTGYSTQAQFNDTIHHFAQLTGTGNFNRTGDGITYLLNHAAKYSMRRESVVMNTQASWIYGATPQKQTNNDFISSLDFNLYKTFPHFYYWGLVNYTSSYSLKINGQLQTGLGVAYRIVDRSDIMFSISNGILFERSNIIQEDQQQLEYQTFRNSLRLQFRMKINDLLTFNSVGFYQPSLQYRNDFIITGNVSLGIKVWKWLSFNTTLNYNNISRTQRENILITYGFVAERFF